MISIRFHGRGGQGAKIASRIVSRAGFVCGLYAQDFALFGAERRGAPLISCTRLSSDPIECRGYVDAPDLIIVIDSTLLTEATAKVFDGIRAGTPVFVNHQLPAGELKFESLNLICVDLTGIARRLIGASFVSAAAAAVAAKSISEISVEALLQAVRMETAESGFTPALVETNALAAREAYALAPAVPLKQREQPSQIVEASVEAFPRLDSRFLAAPVIHRPGGAALRRTGSWRTERPEIEQQKCKRCFLCYLYCPDAAVHLDSENYPHIDYEHCKGCMICYQECPTNAITRHAEV